MSAAHQIAEKLTEAQRRMVLNASARRYKRWRAIRRDAKIQPQHMAGTLWRLFEHPPEWWRGYRLNPLGAQVKSILLKGQPND
ncbi:hypothetical protein AX777_18170 [Sphingobium yanoikuyae]|uniref:Uncharacterized protein n=1 Tax=Sphingobium yanoikuyae TaxID=13690 RepID=A0A177J9L5_SPHYA|nr:hypothetical protein [Sphingobium yanoikuyae]OAH36965.1 hypothetical protein AX777_18170 [Sphingobium yanoikuyae]